MEELIKIDESIKNKIYVIRGKQVMLDSDLAEFYKCKNGTKTVNLAVKRNLKRFPEDFYFQLSKEEYDNLKFQFETSSMNEYGGVRKLPYVFTEQGVAMLASVIRTEVAADISVRIMKTFVAMRHYLYDNNDIYKTLNFINNKMNEYDEKLNIVFSQFDKREKLFLNGEYYDSYSYIHNILKDVKNELFIIDPYADLNLLDIIRDINSKIVLIVSSKSNLSEKQINKFNKQYNDKLTVLKNNNFHDRYIILDKNIVYHLGTSINCLGKKVFSITLLEDKIVRGSLLNFINNIVEV